MQIILIWGEAKKQKNEKLCTINHKKEKKKKKSYVLSICHSIIPSPTSRKKLN